MVKKGLKSFLLCIVLIVVSLFGVACDSSMLESTNTSTTTPTPTPNSNAITKKTTYIYECIYEDDDAIGALLWSTSNTSFESIYVKNKSHPKLYGFFASAKDGDSIHFEWRKSDIEYHEVDGDKVGYYYLYNANVMEIIDSVDIKEVHKDYKSTFKKEITGEYKAVGEKGYLTGTVSRMDSVGTGGYEYVITKNDGTAVGVFDGRASYIIKNDNIYVGAYKTFYVGPSSGAYHTYDVVYVD